jgi:hypothetical protein
MEMEWWKVSGTRLVRRIIISTLIKTNSGHKRASTNALTGEKWEGRARFVNKVQPNKEYPLLAV